MPIREALRELQGEGVLDVFPHRGAVIRGVDRDFVVNFYDVRGGDRGDARRAVRATRGRLGGRSTNGRDRGLRIRERRRKRGWPRIGASTMRSMRAPTIRRRCACSCRGAFSPKRCGCVSATAGGRIEAIIAEHRALLEAIVRRDAAQAGEIARRHCVGARDDLLKRLV